MDTCYDFGIFILFYDVNGKPRQFWMSRNHVTLPTQYIFLQVFNV